MTTSRYQTFLHALLFAATLQIGSSALANEIFQGKVGQTSPGYSQYEGKSCSIEVLEKSDDAIKFIFKVDNSATETIELTKKAKYFTEVGTDYAYRTDGPQVTNTPHIFIEKWHSLKRTPDHLDFESLTFRYTTVVTIRDTRQAANQLICENAKKSESADLNNSK